MSKVVMFAKDCIICHSTENLHACSSCKIVLYCSVACQKEDWPKHRGVCKAREEFCKKRADTPFSCWECKGATTVFDGSCVCLKTFCSDACRTRSTHVSKSAECKRDCAAIEDETHALLENMSLSDMATVPKDMHEEIGENYYKAARLLKFGAHPDIALSRCLMINASRLSYVWAVIEVGHMTQEEIVDGAIYKKV